VKLNKEQLTSFSSHRHRFIFEFNYSSKVKGRGFQTLINSFIQVSNKLFYLIMFIIRYLLIWRRGGRQNQMCIDFNPLLKTASNFRLALIVYWLCYDKKAKAFLNSFTKLFQSGKKYLQLFSYKIKLISSFDVSCKIWQMLSFMSDNGKNGNKGDCCFSF